MKVYRLLPAFLLLFISCSDSGLEEVDAFDFEAFNEFNDTYYQGELAGNLEIAKGYVREAELLLNDSLLSSALILVGNIEYLLGNSIDAHSQYYRSFLVSEEGSYLNQRSIIGIANIYFTLEEYAVVDSLLNRSFLKELQDRVLFTRGMAKFHMEEYEDCHLVMQELYQLYEQDNQYVIPEYKGTMLNILGIVNERIDDFQSAEDFLNQAISSKSLSNDQRSVPMANIGHLYNRLGRFDASNKWYLQAIELAESNDEIANHRLDFAKVLLGRGDLKKAESMLRQVGETPMTSFSVTESILEANVLLARFGTSLDENVVTEALRLNKEFLQKMSFTVQTISSNQVIIEQDYNYHLKLANAQLAKQNLKLWVFSLILAVVLLSITSYLFISKYRQARALAILKAEESISSQAALRYRKLGLGKLESAIQATENKINQLPEDNDGEWWK